MRLQAYKEGPIDKHDFLCPAYVLQSDPTFVCCMEQKDKRVVSRDKRGGAAINRDHKGHEV